MTEPNSHFLGNYSRDVNKLLVEHLKDCMQHSQSTSILLYEYSNSRSIADTPLKKPQTLEKGGGGQKCP
jgi:hypothetical protein